MDTIETQNIDIKLVPPNIERDAPLGVKWLAGDVGRETLRLMGNTDKNNKPSTLDKEKERVHGFIENSNQMNWMIQLKDKVVGSIWVDLEDTEYLPTPSIHLMIGDPESRGHGVGTNACNAVIDFLMDSNKYEVIYSRYLLINTGSANLLKDLGFEKYGNEYSDTDGLEWQNVKLFLKR